MKKFALTVLAFGMISMPAIAGDHDKDMKHKHEDMKEMKIDSAKELIGEYGIAYLATESIGKDVHNNDLEKIGMINDMGISEEGKVKYVVVEMTDGTMMAVPHSGLKWNEEKDALIMKK